VCGQEHDDYDCHYRNSDQADPPTFRGFAVYQRVVHLSTTPQRTAWCQ